MDGLEDGAAYHAELHALLVSNRGVALDKDGSGFVPGRVVKNILSALETRCVGWRLRLKYCSLGLESKLSNVRPTSME